jgi:uncharacterized protein YfkK (UPF0435 family)
LFNSDTLQSGSFNAIEAELLRISAILKKLGLINRLTFTNADFSLYEDHEKLYTLLKKLS